MSPGKSRSPRGRFFTNPENPETRSMSQFSCLSGAGCLATEVFSGCRTDGNSQPLPVDDCKESVLMIKPVRVFAFLADTLRMRPRLRSPNLRDLAMPQELFSPFGPISRIYIAYDRETGEARGFAFVNFMYKCVSGGFRASDSVLLCLCGPPPHRICSPPLARCRGSMWHTTGRRASTAAFICQLPVLAAPCTLLYPPCCEAVNS